MGTYERSLLGPWHHGIRDGHNSVIHMEGDGKEDARVRRCTLSEFTKGTQLVALVLYDDDSFEQRKETVKAARWMLQHCGESAAPMYNILG